MRSKVEDPLVGSIWQGWKETWKDSESLPWTPQWVSAVSSFTDIVEKPSEVDKASVAALAPSLKKSK